MSNVGRRNKGMISRSGKWLIVPLLLVSLAYGIRAEQQNNENPEVLRDWGDYKVIIERNIFSRNRGRVQRIDNQRVARRIIVPNPESYFVLKGIAREHAGGPGLAPSQFIAFFEDTRSGSIMRTKTEDKIARGTIKKLMLDYVEFQLDPNTTTVIKIGDTLEGRVSSPALTYDNLVEWSQMSPEASDSKATSDANQPRQQDDEILKLLMERRKTELAK